MAQKIVKAWLCDLAGCGHIWLADEEPQRCAKCKRRNWNRERCVETEESYVYVVRNLQDGLFKIGTSRKPEKRIAQLGVVCERVLLIGCGTYGFSTEFALHQHFSERRHHGEWFSLNESDIEWIRSLELFNPSKANGFVSITVSCSCHPPRFSTRSDWWDIEFKIKAPIRIIEWGAQDSTVKPPPIVLKREAPSRDVYEAMGRLRAALVPTVTQDEPVDDGIDERNVPEEYREPEVPMCTYREYDDQEGEWYGCRLREHGPKVKHQRGGKL